MEVGSIWQDVKGGLRLMAKRPGFTAAAVLSLALGIGANTTVFSLVSAVFLRPVPVQDPDRVVSVYTQDTRNNQFGYLGSSYLNLKDYRDQSTVFSGFSAVTGNQVRWQRQGTPQPLAAALVNADFFSLLGEENHHGAGFPAGGRRRTGGESGGDHQLRAVVEAVRRADECHRTDHGTRRFTFYHYRCRAGGFP